MSHKPTAVIGTTVILFIVALPVSLLGGVVLRDLWSWFIVPVFGGPTFTVMQAIGLSCVASFFRLTLKSNIPEPSDDKPALVQGIGTLAGWSVGLLILWGTGAFWKLFL